MNDRLQRFRLAPFGLALFCFFLPFVTVSCPGGQYTFSGTDLVTGGTVEGQDLEGEPLAGLALVSAGLGLGVLMIKRRESDVMAIAAGALGAILLLLLKVKIENDVLQQGGGMTAVSFGVGYWGSLLGLGAGSVLVYLLRSGTTFGEGLKRRAGEA